MSDHYDHIAIALIDEDVSNHRLVHDPAADADLEQSIRTNGIQQPVKLNAKGDGRFTLVWGFRRKAVAQRIGLEAIPALVVEGLTTAQIRALQAIENLERKELHPLEEARFCGDLADTLTEEADYTGRASDLTEAIAQRIGRSTKWVENRLAMTRLSERVKQAFLDGDIHLQHVNLIARLAGHDAQEEVLGAVKAQVPPYHIGSDRAEHKRPPSTIAETRSLVEQRLRDLTTVPWKLDATFDGKTACNTCGHNSANRLELFHDDAPKKPQCLLATCYAEKTKFTGRAVQRATNTALKAADKPTKKQVADAIAEREVQFVEPAAVIQATKRRQEPKAPTSSEKRGQQDHERRRKIQDTYWQRQRIWQIDSMNAAKAALPLDHPDAVAILTIIITSGVLDTAGEGEGKAQKDARKRLAQALGAIVTLLDTQPEGAPHPVQVAATALAPHLKSAATNVLHDLQWQDYIAEVLRPLNKLAGIKIDAQEPTLEAIEAELYPEGGTDQEDAA